MVDLVRFCWFRKGLSGDNTDSSREYISVLKQGEAVTNLNMVKIGKKHQRQVTISIGSCSPSETIGGRCDTAIQKGKANRTFTGPLPGATMEIVNNDLSCGRINRKNRQVCNILAVMDRNSFGKPEGMLCACVTVDIKKEGFCTDPKCRHRLLADRHSAADKARLSFTLFHQLAGVFFQRSTDMFDILKHFQKTDHHRGCRAINKTNILKTYLPNYYNNLPISRVFTVLIDGIVCYIRDNFSNNKYFYSLA